MNCQSFNTLISGLQVRGLDVHQIKLKGEAPCYWGLYSIYRNTGIQFEGMEMMVAFTETSNHPKLFWLRAIKWICIHFHSCSLPWPLSLLPSFLFQMPIISSCTPFHLNLFSTPSSIPTLKNNFFIFIPSPFPWVILTISNSFLRLISSWSTLKLKSRNSKNYYYLNVCAYDYAQTLGVRSWVWLKNINTFLEFT